jgi:ABC-type multidrug transport system fused ATPase/permease subunit
VFFSCLFLRRLAAWASQDWSNPERSLALWMGVASVFGGAVTIASLIRSLLFARQTLRAALHMHQDMLSSVFRCPAAWFDVTPIGRVINRCSGDIDKLDHMLGRLLEGVRTKHQTSKGQVHLFSSCLKLIHFVLCCCAVCL